MSETTVPRNCGVRHGHRARAWRKRLSSSFAQTPSGMVQKEVFQAGLGDVDVAQFNASAGSQAGDLRNEGAAAVSVEIGAASVGGAHFPDAGETLETFEEIRGVHPKA